MLEVVVVDRVTGGVPFVAHGVDVGVGRALAQGLVLAGDEVVGFGSELGGAGGHRELGHCIPPCCELTAGAESFFLRASAT